jgi:hypothetical protein
MEYTVQKLAEVSGLSTRALRHYDKSGFIGREAKRSRLSALWRKGSRHAAADFVLPGIGNDSFGHPEILCIRL